MSKKQKTIDILIGVAERGGVENVINMVCPYLQEHGFHVRVVQIVWEGVHWLPDSVPFYPLLHGREGHNLAELSDAYQDFLQSGAGAEHTPDMVLACAWPYMTYIAKNVAVNLKLNYSVVAWPHNPISRYVDAGYGGFEALCFADAHLAISNNLVNEIRNHLPDAVIYRINNPVDMSGISPETTVSVTNRDTLYFIGRLTQVKRPDLIIEALALSHVPWHLKIIGIGDGNEIPELKRFAKEKGVADRVHLLGWQEEPWSLVTNAVALVMASIQEGYPLVAIEAQARGIPVISTPVDGIVELIKPGINGFLFSFGDAGGLAEVFNAMYDGVLPVIEGSSCKEAVMAFEKEAVLQDYVRIIERLLARPKP